MTLYIFYVFLLSDFPDFPDFPTFLTSLTSLSSRLSVFRTLTCCGRDGSFANTYGQQITFRNFRRQIVRDVCDAFCVPTG